MRPADRKSNRCYHGKDKGDNNSNLCHLCWQPGHWNNVPEQRRQGSAPGGGHKWEPSSIGFVGGLMLPPSTGAGTVSRVQIFECSTPPTCAQTQIKEISEIDVPEDFALPEVLMYPFEEQGGGLPESILFSGFAMDGTDLDDNWTYPNSELEVNLMEMGTDLLASVLAVKSGHPQDEGRSVEVVVG